MMHPIDGPDGAPASELSVDELDLVMGGLARVWTDPLDEALRGLVPSLEPCVERLP